MVYTWTQEGSNNYYSYPAMSSYIKSDGTFYLYLAGSNSQRRYEILVSSFAVQVNY